MKKPEPGKKTTIVFPADLHRRVRIRAAEDDADFRSIVFAALRAYLKKPKGGR